VKLIWAGTHAENRAARRTFERTGAELVGDAYAEYEWNL
jgi:RimJ/RimL family protein N-acetyltransferase